MYRITIEIDPSDDEPNELPAREVMRRTVNHLRRALEHDGYDPTACLMVEEKVTTWEVRFV